MPDPLITPNWHAVLIHYPLALVSLGLIIELLSFLWRQSSVRTAARWMLLLGTLACVPAVTSGIYAYRDALSSSKRLTWQELKHDGNLKPVQLEMMRDHILWNSLGTGLLIIVVVTFMGCSDRWRSKLYLPLLLLLLVGLGMLSCGSWHGGEAVYRYGTAVGQMQPVGNPNDMPEDLKRETPLDVRARQFISVMQLHVYLAGVVIALAVVGLGLALRAMTWDAAQRDEAWFEERPAPPVGDGGGQAEGGTGTPPASLDTVKVVKPEETDPLAGTTTHAPAPLPEPPVPAPRWWVLSLLAALLTAAGGIWCAHWYSWSIDIAPMLLDPSEYLKRSGAHLMLGIGIIVLLLVLSLVSRFGKRSRLALWIPTALLALFIAGQIWVGVLLMFDMGDGPLTRFELAPTTRPAKPSPAHLQPTTAPSSPAAAPAIAARAPAVNTEPLVPLEGPAVTTTPAAPPSVVKPVIAPMPDAPPMPPLPATVPATNP